jgi:MoaA/NifB/PqqE/SkfB family radical SAM enzyme
MTSGQAPPWPQARIPQGRIRRPAGAGRDEPGGVFYGSCADSPGVSRSPAALARFYTARVRGSHGWAEIDAARKREILEAIEHGDATRGPSHAELDLTDRCNVACYFCNQQDVRTKEQISLDHLRVLIDELAQSGLKSVRLSGGGDPLAHRDCAAFLDHLEARGVVVDNLTTNAALLGPEIARRLVENRAREVLVSLNAVDAADYERMMQVRPAVFDRVVENVRGLVALRGDSPSPAITVQFLIDRRNYERIPEMYELGRSLGADRIAVNLVLNIPLARIDPEVLLGPPDGPLLQPFVEEVLARDRVERRLQMNFPVVEWNTAIAEIQRRLGYTSELPLFPTASTFSHANGHCFFGWYTATIRGNGDLYPCCLLMTPDYKPLGNALKGSFASHWKGSEFGRLRQEMRDVLLDGENAQFDPKRHRVIRPQCVTEGACWLKNMYFRGDEDFYARLGEALDRARRRNRFRLAFRSIRRRLDAAFHRSESPRSGAPSGQ